MSDLSNYAEGVFRDWMSQGTSAPTPPDPIYVGLHTSAPGEDGANGEVSASDYDRVSVTAGSGWDTPNENDFQNSGEVTFGEATNDWGTVTAVSLWDDTSANSGNCLAAFSLDSDKTISTGDEAKFNAGNLSFSLD